MANGDLANCQRIGDLAVPHSFADLGNDLTFARAEAGDFLCVGIVVRFAARHVSEHVRNHQAVEPCFAGMDFGDGFEKYKLKLKCKKCWSIV